MLTPEAAGNLGLSRCERLGELGILLDPEVEIPWTDVDLGGGLRQGAGGGETVEERLHPRARVLGLGCGRLVHRAPVFRTAAGMPSREGGMSYSIAHIRNDVRLGEA